MSVDNFNNKGPLFFHLRLHSWFSFRPPSNASQCQNKIQHANIKEIMGSEETWRSVRKYQKKKPFRNFEISLTLPFCLISALYLSSWDKKSRKTNKSCRWHTSCSQTPEEIVKKSTRNFRANQFQRSAEYALEFLPLFCTYVLRDSVSPFHFPIFLSWICS